MYAVQNGGMLGFHKRNPEWSRGKVQQGITLDSSRAYDVIRDLFPKGADQPVLPLLGVSLADPSHYRAFRDDDDLQADPDFKPTGLTLRPTPSPSWEERSRP
jgi:hypothetical protein